MPIENIDDWEMRIARQDAFWYGEIIDRPVVNMAISRGTLPEVEEKKYASLRERWFDAEYQAEQALRYFNNTEFLGDALPAMNPNLGPEVFSAFFGSEIEFGEATSWTIPLLEDWDDVDKVKFSTDNFYWKKINEMTDIFLEMGKGKFYTGVTDIHPGGDAIAAFRDPQTMNIDMIENVDEIKSLLKYVNEIFFRVCNFYFDKLQAAGQPITTWAGIVSSKRWYVPSNDFSCMISKAMFDDVFLPGIREECKFLETSIYHLDGPNALQHLDSLLEIEELNVIQWVYGTGNGRGSDWLPVYKKVQAAGKGCQLFLELDEIDIFMENLKPNGLLISVGVSNKEEADMVLKKMLKWK